MTMRYFLQLFLLLAVVDPAGDLAAQTLRPTTRKCEFIQNPLGIDRSRPAFSWTFEARGRNRRQSAYEIMVSTDSTHRIESRSWSSGIVRTAKANGIIYSGKSLSSFTRYYWRLRVWDQDGRPSAWSRNAWFETAMLQAGEWNAQWIGDGRKTPLREEDFYKDRPAPVFRKTFESTKKINTARLYITGLGYYEAYINGQKAGTELLAPGWTSFDKTVLYRSLDITSLLQHGTNIIGVMLGNGWYNPLPLHMWGARNLREHLTIGEPCVKAMVRILYADGTTRVIATDASWQTAPGPVIRNNVYLGEHYDARAGIEDWNGSRGIWAAAKQAVKVPGPAGRMQAQLQPGVEITRVVHPVKITVTRPGVYLVDMGQNFAGVARIRLKAPAGTQVALRYGEDVYKDGSLNGMTSVAGQVKSENGGPGAPPVAWQEDRYTASGKGEEVWHPRFTFHGFRYVEITGWPGTPQLSDIEGLRMSAAVEETGTFNCSNAMFNKLAENIRWTFLSNLFSVQSDCPAREKFGYGGDMFCTAEAFNFNFDMANFYRKVLQDHEDAQRPLGGITETAPYMGIADSGPGDQSGPLGFQIGFAYVIRQVYDFYGDQQVIRQHYPALKRQAQFLTDRAKGHLYDTDLSDHESLDEKPFAFAASCFYYHHIRSMSEFAGILGEKADHKKYQRLADTIRQAIVRKFYKAGSGTFDNGTQSAQFFGLWYHLLDQRQEQKALAVMEQAVAAKKNHLSTGIFATKMLFDVLRTHNRNDLAYTIADQRDYPGWGHMIDGGATTLWETWRYSDNTYSQNHPMFGSVSEWFYRSLLGINAAAPGFEKIRIKPQPAGNLTAAGGTYRSVGGTIQSSWKKEGRGYHLTVTIPPNTSAEVWIPTAQGASVTESGKNIRSVKDIRVLPVADGYTVVQVGSGEYRFVSH